MSNSRLLNKNNNSIKYMQIGTIEYQKLNIKKYSGHFLIGMSIFLKKRTMWKKSP